MLKSYLLTSIVCIDRSLKAKLTISCSYKGDHTVPWEDTRGPPNPFQLRQKEFIKEVTFSMKTEGSFS